MRGAALLAGALLLAPPPAAGEGIRSFAPGERIEFVLSWMGVDAGDSVMEVERLLRPGEADAWRVSSVTTSRAAVDLVYKVRNRYETWLDPRAGLSLKYIIHQDEGGKKRDLVQVHDQERNEVTLLKREKGTSVSEVFKVPPGSIDTLSALYLIRERTFAVGETLRFPVFEGKKSYDLEVTVEGKERIEVRGQWWETFKLRPRVKHEGIFRAKGEMFVWMTADPRHLPVLLKTKVPVGNVTAELARYVPPPDAGGGAQAFPPVPAPGETP